MKLTSHYFAKQMEGQNGTSTQTFYLIFESDFDSVYLYVPCPLLGPWLDNQILSYTISCLPFSNVSKISVYKIYLEIYLCILNSEFYVMYIISIHSMWQITSKHFMLCILSNPNIF